MRTGNPAVDAALARLRATMEEPGAVRTLEEIAAYEARVKQASAAHRRAMREHLAAKQAKGRRMPYRD